MNSVAEEILMHYGMPRRSGRYPYGSGEDPYQHGRDFLGRVDELRKQNFTYTDKDGKTWTGDTAIAKFMGISTTDLRREISYAKDERRALQVETAKRLRDKEGMSATEIGRQMGVNESTVRSWFNAESEARMNKAKQIAADIKKVVDEKGMVDVGADVERELRISKEKLGEALYILEREGYPVYSGGIPQVTNPGQQTNQKVICRPGTEHKEIYNYDKVHSLKEYISRDGGMTLEKKFNYPESMDSKRLMVRYNEEGGLEKDGIVELRRGVADLSLGESRYSQVRILVDGTHYIKGMAVYADDKDMPDGVDVIFNTNKKAGTPMEKVLKEIKKDPDNPFGSAIKDADQGGQYWYDPKTGERVSASHKGAKLGLINKRADEGDWDDWKDALPSQFLGKQSRTMAKKQLDLAKADKLDEYEAICELNNPTIKKHLLQKFADSCDSAAVHLQAAALPGQKYHVIIPVNSLKEDEVYAPGYENGTKLALIRYPHGGTFEIPIQTVNNKNATARKLIGTDPIDAVCINSKVAERLSGADFDGDTVMCIPTHDKRGRVKVTSTKELEGLKGFDPKVKYGHDEERVDDEGNVHYYRNGREFKVMRNTQTEMGKISNLITDMTLGGAGPEKLARAVRHSMVVIDAEKHKLDYKQSEIDNNIIALKKEYQPKYDDDGNLVGYGGAATILSRAKGETSVAKRQGSPKINIKGTEDYDPTKPEGSLIYKTADDLYKPIRTVNKKTGVVTLTTTDGEKIKYDPKDEESRAKYQPIKKKNEETGEIYYESKSGKHKYALEERTQPSTKMAETDDAYSLVSDARHPMELIYADYANSMKSLANQARVEMVNSGKIAYDRSANNTYKEEVRSLEEKLRTAKLNAPRERAAQRMANAEVEAKMRAYKLENGTDMKKSDVKKISQQALTKYRAEVNAVRRADRAIDISDREWEAIQAGAISENKLKQILDNTDVDKLRQRATPRATTTLSPAKINRIKNMSASNYTINEIAKKLGVPTSTVASYLKGVN